MIQKVEARMAEDGTEEHSTSPSLPPFRKDVAGREITFALAHNLEAATAVATAGNYVLVMLSAPDISDFGLFIGLTPAEARNLATGLMRSADEAEAEGRVLQ